MLQKITNVCDFFVKLQLIFKIFLVQKTNYFFRYSSILGNIRNVF